MSGKNSNGKAQGAPSGGRNRGLFVGGIVLLIMGAVVVAVLIGLFVMDSGSSEQQVQTTSEISDTNVSENEEEGDSSDPEIDADSEASPAATETPEPTAAPTEEADATATMEPTPTPDQDQDQEQEPTASPTDAPAVSATDTPATDEEEETTDENGTAAIIGNNATIFACPDAESAQLNNLPAGTQADKVLGRTSNNNWILIEYQDEEGWVSKNFVTVQNLEIQSLDVATSCTVEATVESTPTTEASEPADLNAYWNASASKETIGEGKWQATFTVRVPQGGTYTFQVGQLNTTHLYDRQEGSNDFYLVTVAGMSCDGALVENLTVTRNGVQLNLFREGGEANSAIYIESPQC